MKPISRMPPVAAILFCTAATGATVAELKPGEVAAFVARHEYAIVQVTSPDRKCGYCIGADKKFDKAAAEAGERKFAFARVQHSPWRAIPDWGPLMSVWGVPGHAIFRNGKQIGQVSIYRETPATFYEEVDAVLAGPAKTPPVDPAAPPAAKPAGKALTAEQTAALRTMMRRDLLQGAMNACGKRFPAGAAKYRDSVARWEQPRKEELNKGALALLLGSREHVKTLLTEEQQALQKWQTDELGLPMTKKVEAADCDRFAAALATLR